MLLSIDKVLLIMVKPGPRTNAVSFLYQQRARQRKGIDGQVNSNLGNVAFLCRRYLEPGACLERNVQVSDVALQVIV